MTKTIFEEMGGTYRQVGDYLLPNITVPAEEEIEPIGLWGKRHARHLKEHYKVLYMNLLTSGKLHSYLAEVDKQAGSYITLYSVPLNALHVVSPINQSALFLLRLVL